MDKKTAIVFIEWKDATYSPGWHFIDEVPMAPTVIQSVGFLIAENEAVCVLALSINDQKNVFGHISVIPKTNITARYQLSDE